MVDMGFDVPRRQRHERVVAQRLGAHLRRVQRPRRIRARGSPRRDCPATTSFDYFKAKGAARGPTSGYRDVRLYEGMPITATAALTRNTSNADIPDQAVADA